MIGETESQSILQSMNEISRRYAEKKAARVKIENFRASKRAILMKAAEAIGYSKVSEQEREAVAHREYVELGDGHAAALHEEELLKWQLEIRQNQFRLLLTRIAYEREELRFHGRAA